MKSSAKKDPYVLRPSKSNAELWVLLQAGGPKSQVLTLDVVYYSWVDIDINYF